MKGPWVAASVVLALAGTPASAQETYVSASLTGEIVRFSGTETAGLPGFSGGEAIGMAFRAGTRLGAAWGVEAEFARPAEIRHALVPDLIPLPSTMLRFIGPDGTIVSPPDLASLIFPPRAYRVETRYRDTTFSAGIWARQAFSARLALVYAGGVGFHRTQQENTISIEPFPIFLPDPIQLPGFPTIPRVPLLTEPVTYRSETTTYSARPFAGIEARLRMTEHVELVPGVRVHGLNGGVLVRPSVGLGWIF